MKAGSRTGVTFGRLTGSQALVRQLTTLDRTEISNTTLLEHTILSEGGTGQFALHGDSGALVRDLQCKPVGFLFGGFTNPTHEPEGQPGHLHAGNATVTAACRVGVMLDFFRPPGVNPAGICLFTPFAAVLEHMRATLAEGEGGPVELELVL